MEIASGFAAAGLCGQLLAGLGAEVVKLEVAAGDPLRTAGHPLADGNAYAFHLLNAGKDSSMLRADAPARAQQLQALTEWADVVLVGETGAGAGIEPDVAAALAPERFAAQWPTRVLCAISTFGRDGARAGWAGNEFVAQAMGGLMACTGYPERAPVRSGTPYAAHVAALFGLQAILAGLRARERDGAGQVIDIGVVDCLVALLGNFIPSFFLTGKEPKRIGNRHTIAAPWNIYPTKDGYVVICTGTGGSHWWKTICGVIGREDLALDPRYDVEAKRVERVDEVDAIVGEWTQRHTMAEAAGAMSKVGIPAGEINPVEAMLAHPHYRATRALVVERSVPGGARSVQLAGLPIKVGAWEPPSGRAGPALGSRPVPRAAAQARATTALFSAGRTPSLKGIRVLEFGSRTSAPMAGRMLADLGADVVKIEPRKGESLRGAGQQIGGSSYLFHINNGGKRSVVVEHTTDAGRELVVKLAAQADVWIENLAPGALDKLGLGYKHLGAGNPRLVYCSISGFGYRSDFADAKAFDTVVQAACGGMYITGYPDHLPVKIGMSSSDLAAGVSAVGAVLAALRERDRTGAGMHIDLAMADVGVWMTQNAWPEVFHGSGHPQRSGNRSAEACPHNIFAVRDGFVAIAADDDAMWQRLAGLVGGPALRADGRFATLASRLAHIDALEALITHWAASQDGAAAAAACQAVQVCAAPVRKLRDIVEDADVRARGLVMEVDHPLGGRMKVLGNPLRLSGTPTAVGGAAPVLGEHTAEVLSEWLHLGRDRIDPLAAAGVIVLADPRAGAAAADAGRK
ncbi:MAG: CoA transferase [Burkholderiales bacterium]|nr:CoA transferase [Burkholderiales bacterium]